jgi:hypothetical protein
MGSGEPTKRGRGRPALPAGEGKRYPLNMRTTAEIRDRLVAAANASGRSFAQEAEFRIEQSYAEDDRLGGPITRALVTMLAAAIADAEQRTGKSWLTDRVTYRRALLSVHAIIGRLGPEPEKKALAAMDKRA